MLAGKVGAEIGFADLTEHQRLAPATISVNAHRFKIRCHRHSSLIY
jgi:hypothetical protein